MEGAIDGRLDVRRVKVGKGGGEDAMVADHDEPPEVHGRPGRPVRVGLRGLLLLDLVHSYAGGVDGEDSAAAAYDWLCRSGTGYGYLQKPAAAAMALRAACSGRINTR